MRQPLGNIINLTFSPIRSWLSLGPGWAALAGALSTGQIEFSFSRLLPLIGLWLLVDPLLGMLWELAATRRLGHALLPTQLPPTPRHGFCLPYAQPHTAAGRLSLWGRRYGRWWGETFWPERGAQVIAFIFGVGLALGLSLSLAPTDPTLFWLTLLAIGLTLLAGPTATDLAAPEGGRLQSIGQLLLPWVMGVVLWSTLTPFGLSLAICYWVTYLGGLRMSGGHARAEILFWFGQIAAILLLLALHLLPGAALLGVLLIAQQIIKTKFSPASDFLPRTQPYLVLSVLIAGWSIGGL